MKKLLLSSRMLVALLFINLQIIQAQLTTIPDGGNKKASISERIGITDVSVHYNRPAVKGREGKIWGQLVGYGFNDPGFGTSKAAPWRAGANENTLIEFSTDVKIEGRELPAGRYGFHIAISPETCTLIFSKNSSSWGSFFYDEKEDALRVAVKPQVMDNKVEWLKYEFMDETVNSAVVALLWEKWKIPFKIEVDYIKTQLESFRRELRSDKGFNWRAWQQAAVFCVQANTNLEEGLGWAEAAVSRPFVGDRNFVTLSTKAQVLGKLNRMAEADSLMKEAMPLGKATEVHTYARQLLMQKRYKEAFDAFKFNYDKHPNEFTTLMGMVRGYSALGDFKKALSFAEKALPKAPDKLNKDNLEGMLGKLKDGKDVN